MAFTAIKISMINKSRKSIFFFAKILHDTLLNVKSRDSWAFETKALTEYQKKIIIFKSKSNSVESYRKASHRL